MNVLRVCGLSVVGVLLGWGSVSADVVYLRDGRVLEGEVEERGNTVSIMQDQGGITVLREEVLRIEYEGPREEDRPRNIDEVLLRNGRVIRGDARVTEDGAEVIVRQGDRGEVRHPRQDVAMIRWRDGTEDTPAVGEDMERLHATLLQLVNDLTGRDPALAAQARRELLALGPFARSYLDALSQEEPALLEILEDLDRLEEIRQHMPARVEELVPNLGERLVSDAAEDRERALRAVVVEAPDDVGPLLLFMCRTDPTNAIKAYCVTQMASLRCFEELAEVLKMPNGPLRLSAALALGDAGIYAGVPILIDALRLDDPQAPNESLQIRTVAVDKLREYTGQFFGFRPEGRGEDREAALQRWERWWQENGDELVRRSIKEVAPNLAGAQITDEERAEAQRIWEQADEIMRETLAELVVDEREDEETQQLQRRQRRARLERVTELLGDALELDPSLCSARMTRAVLLYEELDRYREAERELNLLITRADYDPGDPDAAKKVSNYHLGQIALREQNWRQATVRFTQAVHYDEHFTQALEAQGDAFMGMALDSREDVRLQQAARLDALRSAVRGYRNALTSIDQQRDDIQDVMRELVSDRPANLEEGLIVESMRKSARDLEAFKASIYFKLGRVHSALQEDTLALNAFREAAALSPETERYHEAVRVWTRIAGRRGAETPREETPREGTPREETPREETPEGGTEEESP